MIKLSKLPEEMLHKFIIYLIFYIIFMFSNYYLYYAF